MAKKTPTPEEQIKNLAAEIIREAKRWENLKENGGSDAFYEDGFNMNLTRNHIIYDKGEIKRICEESGAAYPQEYETPTPPEVDNHYMARAQEISENAVKTLATYKSNGDYVWLVREGATLSDEEAKQVSIGNVLGYVSGLQHAIEHNSLVDMRRHESRPDIYLESFRDCRTRVQEVLNKRKTEVEMPIGQLTIFDIYGADCMGGMRL